MEYGEEKKTYGVLLPVLLVVALLIGYFYLKPGSSRKVSPENGGELVLHTAPLQPQDVTVEKTYIGYVTPINDVDVIPYISGFLEDVYVEGGQEVAAGDTLIVIRQNEYKARMDAAAAQVLEAQANFNNAQVYYRRIRSAGARAVSKTEVDNAKASYLSAEAQLAAAKADYELAKVNYDYTVIQAPISGIVGNVSLTKGDYVSPSGQPLLSIIQYNPIRVVFSITDKDYLEETGKGGLFAGEKIRLRLADGRIFEQPGTYRFADNQINCSTNSIAVYADFANADKTLIANAYVDVLVERKYTDGILIRQSLVTLAPDGSYVYVVNGNRLDKVRIDIVASVGSDYLVRNGFQKGDRIVLDKVGTIRKDQKIRVVSADGQEGK